MDRCLLVHSLFKLFVHISTASDLALTDIGYGYNCRPSSLIRLLILLMFSFIHSPYDLILSFFCHCVHTYIKESNYETPPYAKKSISPVSISLSLFLSFSVLGSMSIVSAVPSITYGNGLICGFFFFLHLIEM